MGTGAGTWPIVHSDCRTQAIRARFRCRGRCVACDEDRHSCHRLQLRCILWLPKIGYAKALRVVQLYAFRTAALG